MPCCYSFAATLWWWTRSHNVALLHDTDTPGYRDTCQPLMTSNKSYSVDGVRRWSSACLCLCLPCWGCPHKPWRCDYNAQWSLAQPSRPHITHMSWSAHELVALDVRGSTCALCSSQQALWYMHAASLNTSAKHSTGNMPGRLEAQRQRLQAMAPQLSIPKTTTDSSCTCRL